MPGDERAGRGPGRRRLQDRGLDLHEVLVVEEPPDAADDLRPGLEPFPRLLVDQQVQVAAPVAGLDVGDALPLVRQRADRLVQNGELGHRDRPLTAAGGVKRAGDADEVADFHGAGPFPDDVRAELIPGQRDLHAPAAVLNVTEDQTTHPPPEDDPAGEPDGRPVRRLLCVGGHRVRVVAGPGRRRPVLLRRHQLHLLSWIKQHPGGHEGGVHDDDAHLDGAGQPDERDRRPRGGQTSLPTADPGSTAADYEVDDWDVDPQRSASARSALI